MCKRERATEHNWGWEQGTLFVSSPLLTDFKKTKDVQALYLKTLNYV